MSVLSGRSLMHHRYGDGHYQQIIVHTKTGRMLKLDVLDIDEDETCCGPCNTPTNEMHENGRKEGEMEGTPTSSIGSRPLSHHRRQNRPTFFNYHAKHTMMDPAFSPSCVNHRFSPSSSSSCCDSPQHVEPTMSCRSYSSPPTTPAYRPTVTVDVPQCDDEPIVIDPPTTVTFSHDSSAEVINISITTPVIPPDFKPPPTLSRPLSCPSHHLSVSAPSSATSTPRSPSQRCYANGMRRSSDCMIHSSRAYSSTTVHAALASIKSITPRMPPKKIFSRSAPSSPVSTSSSCESTRSHSSCDITRTEEDGEGEEGQIKTFVEKEGTTPLSQLVDEKSMLPSESTTTTSISISFTSTTPVAESSTSPSTSTCMIEGEIKLKDKSEKECKTKVEETSTSESKNDDEASTSESKNDDISSSDSSDDTDEDPDDMKHEYKDEYKWNDVIPVEIHAPSRRITPIISPHPHKPIRLHSPHHTSHVPLHLHMHTHTHMSHYNTHPSHHTYPTTLPYTSHVQVHTTRPTYVSTVQRQLQHLQPMYSPHHVPSSSHVHPHIYPSSTSTSAAPYHQTVTYSQPSAV